MLSGQRETRVLTVPGQLWLTEGQVGVRGSTCDRGESTGRRHLHLGCSRKRLGGMGWGGVGWRYLESLTSSRRV